MKHVLVLGAILALYVVLYARSVDYAYVWDDVHTLRDSDFFERPLGEQLRVTEMQRIDPATPTLRGIAPAHESYRPLTLLDQALDVRVFGRASPAPMHVHNLVLGALAILVAWWLARRLLGDATSALAVAAIFALHPLHVEPFAYISARADLLSGLLGLAALALVVELGPPDGPARERTTRIALAAGAALLYLAALFAKESIVALPVVAFGFALATKRVRVWAPGLIALVAVVPCYLALRHALIPDAPAATTPALALDAFVSLPALALQTLTSFVLPFDISIARPARIPPLLGWCVVVAAIATLAIAWRTGRLGRRTSTAAVAVASTALWIGPAAVAVATLGALADRYLYVALLGPALAAVIGVRWLAARWRVPVVAAVALWGATCVFVTYRELPFWQSNETLFAHAMTVEPSSGLARFHVAMLRFDAGRWDDAVDLLEDAARLAPTDDRVLNNLAVCYMNLGRMDDAEHALWRVLARTGGATFRPWYNLGVIAQLRGDRDAACGAWTRALQINPSYGRARADFDRVCTPRRNR